MVGGARAAHAVRAQSAAQKWSTKVPTSHASAQSSRDVRARASFGVRGGVARMPRARHDAGPCRVSCPRFLMLTWPLCSLINLHHVHGKLLHSKTGSPSKVTSSATTLARGHQIELALGRVKALDPLFPSPCPAPDNSPSLRRGKHISFCPAHGTRPPTHLQEPSAGQMVGISLPYRSPIAGGAAPAIYS